MSTKRIVICGSMSFYDQMVRVNEMLSKDLIPSVLPMDDDDKAFNLTKEKFEEYKRRVSFQYLKKIRSPETWSVLVINSEKHAIENYIGPNSFAEIAVAFANKKKVYLMYGVPDVYEDELLAWRAISLNGSIDRMISDFRKVCMIDNSQLMLFPDKY